MTSLICPHGYVGLCGACLSLREARELGEAIGAEAGTLVGEVIAEPLRVLKAERDQLAAIVRAVAAFSPQADADSYPVQCLFCDDEFDLSGSQRPDLHEPDCLWRRACEWAAAHPEETP